MQIEIVIEPSPRRHLKALTIPELTEWFLGGGHHFGRHATTEPPRQHAEHPAIWRVVVRLPHSVHARLDWDELNVGSACR